jgi:SAM-dependent methyltransferase
MDTPARIEANRALWDTWTRRHVPSEFYGVEGFLADPPSRPLDRITRELLGDIRGMRALHLQCHFGLDTVRLALMGAEVTGVDFSHEAVDAGRALAERAGISATFVCSDVLDLSPEVPKDSFDLVFTSHGAISWLPDLRPWARGVASRLAPGGVFHVLDMHPTLWMFDDETEGPELKVRYSYFSREALEWEEHGSYASPGEEITGTSHSWQHTFEEIIGSLVEAGLAIESLREYPLLSWQFVKPMYEVEPGLYGLPAESGDVPLMFSVTARKPG